MKRNELFFKVPIYSKEITFKNIKQNKSHELLTGWAIFVSLILFQHIAACLVYNMFQTNYIYIIISYILSSN